MPLSTKSSQHNNFPESPQYFSPRTHDTIDFPRNPHNKTFPPKLTKSPPRKFLSFGGKVLCCGIRESCCVVSHSQHNNFQLNLILRSTTVIFVISFLVTLCKFYVTVVFFRAIIIHFRIFHVRILLYYLRKTEKDIIRLFIRCCC